jgi:anti-sigma-K factor RskA
MTTHDDIDDLAGEYVLGTLDKAERAQVAARRLREATLDAAIRGWEVRLAPLNESTGAASPPADLLQRIERRIDDVKTSGTAIVNIADLQRRVQRWRRVAVAASAIAASLMVVVGVREGLYRDQPQTYVAVFAKDDVLPAFYFTIDLKSRELTIRPVGAERQPGKTYQMWIASDQLGPGPQSLGLVDDTLAPTRKSLTNFDPNLLQTATFGVSLEPTGGSPTGKPTSPALHSKLLPVSH